MVIRGLAILPGRIEGKALSAYGYGTRSSARTTRTLTRTRTRTILRTSTRTCTRFRHSYSVTSKCLSFSELRCELCPSSQHRTSVRVHHTRVVPVRTTLYSSSRLLYPPRYLLRALSTTTTTITSYTNTYSTRRYSTPNQTYATVRIVLEAN